MIVNKRNNVLELRGKRFIQAAKSNQNGGASMNSQKIVTSEQLINLQAQLKNIKAFWQLENQPFEGILISVHYNKIAAKSNRISGLFKGNKSNDAVVGAKYNENKNKHIITYFLDIEDLDYSIELLSQTIKILDESFQGRIDKSIFDSEIVFGNQKKNKKGTVRFEHSLLKKSRFKQVVADASYIDNFEVEKATPQLRHSIITLFDTRTDTKTLLRKIGIDVLSARILEKNTVFLDENQVKLLFEKAPYLVSMATSDLLELSPDDFIKAYPKEILSMPSPSIEPTIGVIDTLFDEQVYFSKWVEYYDMVDENIPKTTADYNHGTAVSSIIVDGARLNPWLDDGCGRFKVRHFGVATASSFSSFTIIKKIKEIIMNNPDIKVWNISLGSNQEINDNFISAEAAVLDQIQYENDVIFVVAGTNKPSANIIKIGSPADSINSMVVNAVTKSGLSTKYTRKGLALSFFAKPDVSYYGGSEEQYIKVCKPLGGGEVSGTSYAAPWIARKLSYLIDVLGLNREIAKAMIIDAARCWNEKPTPEEVALYGHGVVPIKIDDIVQTKADEIKFLVSDISEKWNTYNYDFPVPLKGDKYPYVTRATMCYFPVCERTQGVDYTNTELHLKFERIQDNGRIKARSGDKQNQDSIEDERNYLLEGDARIEFRKWDNVKYVAEKFTNRSGSKKSFNRKNWGMEVTTSNRLNPKDGIGLRFGVVVTLKAIDGINRIDEFIKNCTLNGWLVAELDVQARIDINQKVQEDIEFE
ncbi:MAG: S8 family peptidase [Defluviitaleaceae bacterium]|nr:S8 family peptidase [Defluviitaleaceae bacterium]